MGWPVWGKDLVQHLAGFEDFVGLDFDIRDLPADLAVGLVDHDFGVRQGEAFALGAAGQKHRPAAGRHTHAIGRHGTAEDLHGVVDGQGGADAAAGRIDVEWMSLRRFSLCKYSSFITSSLALASWISPCKRMILFSSSKSPRVSWRCR